MKSVPDFSTTIEIFEHIIRNCAWDLDHLKTIDYLAGFRD